MALSAFIRDRYEDIINEFAVLARTLMPPAMQVSSSADTGTTVTVTLPTA